MWAHQEAFLKNKCRLTWKYTINYVLWQIQNVCASTGHQEHILGCLCCPPVNWGTNINPQEPFVRSLFLINKKNNISIASSPAASTSYADIYFLAWWLFMFGAGSWRSLTDNSWLHSQRWPDSTRPQRGNKWKTPHVLSRGTHCEIMTTLMTENRRRIDWTQRPRWLFALSDP